MSPLLLGHGLGHSTQSSAITPRTLSHSQDPPLPLLPIATHMAAVFRIDAYRYETDVRALNMAGRRWHQEAPLRLSTEITHIRRNSDRLAAFVSAAPCDPVGGNAQLAVQVSA